jgi:two-component system, chemotaxis family, protein-glutamate methylesterase/glutaminase
MPSKDSQRIVVIGGSAGSLDPLLYLFSKLTSDVDATYFVVQHISADAPQFLSQLIGRSGVLPAQVAVDGERFERGHVYVAPPDHHLMVHDGSTRLSHGPRENRTRPAIDPLFRSAAVEHGSHVIGVLLSGMLDDGSSGMVAIKRCGGTTIVQDPRDAAFPDMPSSALAALDVDHCATIDQIPELITSVARSEPKPFLDVPRDLQLEVDITARSTGTADREDMIGRRSTMSCPECGGPMWEMDHDHKPRYRCTVGHSYTGRNLLADQELAVERALWAAIRTLEERRRLLEQLTSDADARGHDRLAETYRSRRDEAIVHIDQIKSLLIGRI